MKPKPHTDAAGGALSSTALFDAPCFIDRLAFMAAKRAYLSEAAKCPESKNIIAGHWGKSGIDELNGLDDGTSGCRENNGAHILRVSVLFDESCMQHPIKKLIEIVRVSWRLVAIGWHVMLASSNTQLTKT